MEIVTLKLRYAVPPCQGHLRAPGWVLHSHHQPSSQERTKRQTSDLDTIVSGRMLTHGPSLFCLPSARSSPSAIPVLQAGM